MRIIHVFRGAVGGLFRHVCDQALGQAQAGNDVGIVCDSLTGGAESAAKLETLEAICSLGVTRMPMATLPGSADLGVIKLVTDIARSKKAKILHGHGAKGGLYARLAARRLACASVYTPHGGSLHYEWRNPKGALFLAAERALRFKSTGLLFVCDFERREYAKKIGLGACRSAVVYNGLTPADFTARKLGPGASDLLFVGEMRHIKGVDTLLRALALLPAAGRPSLTLVGDGAELASFQALANEVGVGAQVKFAGRRPMAVAQSLGRVLVVPSRRESFPYVVIEAMAAAIPLIASNVGGIAEALPDRCLVPAGDARALADKIAAATANAANTEALAQGLLSATRDRFSSQRMVQDTLGFYRSLI